MFTSKAFSTFNTIWISGSISLLDAAGIRWNILIMAAQMSITFEKTQT
jgi:hypothetical protein